LQALLHHIRIGQRALVHCELGRSRAPAVVAAYLYYIGFQLDTALTLVRRVRPQANPHPAIWQSIEELCR
jgi:protein-tyrosine phosphatase